MSDTRVGLPAGAVGLALPAVVGGGSALNWQGRSTFALKLVERTLCRHLFAPTLPLSVSFPDFNETRWFAEHLQPHEGLLRAWLGSRVDVRAEIDDIVQESFVRVLRARQRGEVQSPKAFLFATARNLVLDALRRRRVARTEALVENEALDVLDEAEAIPEAVARNQELALLTEAIQSLPDRCRQVFTLRKVYGLSQREIAVQLGVSEHTVSAQLTIGLHKCTAYLRRRRDGSGGRP